MNLTLSLWTSLLGRLATEAVLLVALAAVAQRFITAPRVRGTLWQAVLLGVALVWMAELAGARGQVVRWWPQPREARHLVATIVGEPVADLPVMNGFEAVTEPVFPELVALPSRPVWWPLQLWLAGLAALLFRTTALRLWLGLAAVRRKQVNDPELLERVENLRRCVGLRRVRVLVWPGLRSPIAFGTLRPTIALPADFAARFGHEAQEAMLAHELAHLAASDPFWLALADVVLALAWWHPAVWWARWQLRAASEAAADEASALVPGGRVALAESLVTLGHELSAPRWTRGLGVAGDGLKSQLARRVTALLRPARDWRAVRPGRMWLARGATVIATAGLVALPWPGAGGPALAEVLIASVAAAAPAASLPERPSAGLARTDSAPESASVPLTPAGDWRNSARLAYDAVDVRPPSILNTLNLTNRYLGPVGATEAKPRALRQEYQEGSPKVRGIPVGPGDWIQPANPVYVALRTDEQAGRTLNFPLPSEARTGSPGSGTEPGKDLEMRQRYQQAMQAAKEADLACFPILAAHGQDSAEFGRASERYERAKAKVALLKAVIDSDQEVEALRQHYRPKHPKVVVALAARTGLLAKLEELPPDLNTPDLTPPPLLTRQFRIPNEQRTGINEHFRRSLPPGETNIQVAIRAFCATNGMDFRAVTVAAAGPLQVDDARAVFYDDRTGVLFARATQDELGRLEMALQTFVGSAVPADARVPKSPEKAASAPVSAAAKPADSAELQQRLGLARRAAKEADTAAGSILEKYGEDSPESRQASDRYENAREKVRLLESAVAEGQQWESWRVQFGEQDPKVEQALAKQNSVLAELERFSKAEAAGTPLLFTRQFGLRVKGPTALANHMRRFLPPGETNLQVAVRAFCATNGVPVGIRRDPTDKRADQLQTAAFLNEGGGLFVRATLGDLGRIERALQTLDLQYLSPAEAEEIRAGQARMQQASAARLAGLRARFNDYDPQVRAELADLAAVEKSQRDLDLNAPPAGTNAPVARGAATSQRQIQLEIFFAEVVERGSDDLGLDWVFGKSPTNNAAVQSGPAAKLLTEPGSPHGQNLQVDLLRTEGESAILSGVQFAALRKQLDGRSGVDFIAAPKVITNSGRQARVAVGEAKTIVSGVESMPATGTNQAGINYQTEKVIVGPQVDLFPVLEGDNTRLGIIASVTEFMGYDQPAAPTRDQAAKGVTGVTPAPRLRVRTLHADSLSRPGDTVALRGPLVSETFNFKDKVPVLGDVPLLGRLFRNEGKSIVRKRLYVFVTPVEVTATGEPSGKRALIVPAEPSR